jgi:hypothetical protein
VTSQEPRAETLGAAPTLEELTTFVEDTLKELLDVDDIARDDDGDLPFTYGSAKFFVRVRAEPPIVHVFSPLLWGIGESPELLRALNDINLRTHAARLAWTGAQVVAMIDLPGAWLARATLAAACDYIGGLADHFDDELQGRFGGETMLGERLPEKPSTTAGYL